MTGGHGGGEAYTFVASLDLILQVLQLLAICARCI